MRIVAYTRSIVAVSALTFILVACGSAAPDPLAYQRAQIALDQQQQSIQASQARAAVLETPYRVLLIALTLAPVALLIVGLDAYRLRRRLVIADAAGKLPMPRSIVEQDPRPAIAALGAFHATEYQRVSGARTAMLAPSAPALITSQPDVPVPSLPTIVELSDIHAKPGHIALGVLPGGHLLEVDLAHCYHALCHGDTRSGKTNTLDAVIAQLHHMSRLQPLVLHAADFKRELGATWGRSRLFPDGIATEPGDIADLLEDLVRGPDGVLRRYDRFRDVGQQANRIVRNSREYQAVTGEQPTISITILDELNALLEASKKVPRVADNMRILLQTGAGAGHFVLGGAQYLKADVFGRDGSKQFVTRCHFGAYDATAVRMLFGQVDDLTTDLLDGTPGRGLVRTVQQQGATVFQSLHCSEQDILEAMQALPTVDTNAVITVEPSEPRFIASVPHEPGFTESAPRPEIAEIVRRLKERGESQTSIIETVWGARKGGTERYRQAVEAYRSITSGAS